jgi:hypothetical protein
MKTLPLLVTIVFSLGILTGVLVHYTMYRPYEYYLILNRDNTVDVYSPSSDTSYRCEFDSIPAVLLKDNL